LAPAWSSDGTKVLYDWGIPRYIGLLQVAAGKTMQVVKHPKYGLIQGRFSPDDRWISFLCMRGAGGHAVMVAPFRGPAVIPESQWIAVSDGSAFDMRPRWSPDGNLLYYHSNRDGFRCLWAQRLDPGTKRPLGGPFCVRHFHSPRRSLAPLPEAFMSISVGRDRIILSLQERTGNIWTFKLPDER
jgi:Tol biopolymer transport system component